jgi:hypothetical protein
MAYFLLDWRHRSQPPELGETLFWDGERLQYPLSGYPGGIERRLISFTPRPLPYLATSPPHRLLLVACGAPFASQHDRPPSGAPSAGPRAQSSAREDRSAPLRVSVARCRCFAVSDRRDQDPAAPHRECQRARVDFGPLSMRSIENRAAQIKQTTKIVCIFDGHPPITGPAARRKASKTRCSVLR